MHSIALHSLTCGYWRFSICPLKYTPRLNEFAHDLRKSLGSVNASSLVWPMIHNHLVIPIFPSVDRKTHCALNCSTYGICHTSERSREARLQNYRHSKLVKSSSPICIQNGLITLVLNLIVPSYSSEEDSICRLNWTYVWMIIIAKKRNRLTILLVLLDSEGNF